MCGRMVVFCVHQTRRKYNIKTKPSPFIVLLFLLFWLFWQVVLQTDFVMRSMSRNGIISDIHYAHIVLFVFNHNEIWHDGPNNQILSTLTVNDIRNFQLHYMYSCNRHNRYVLIGAPFVIRMRHNTLAQRTRHCRLPCQWTILEHSELNSFSSLRIPWSVIRFGATKQQFHNTQIAWMFNSWILSPISNNEAYLSSHRISIQSSHAAQCLYMCYNKNGTQW